MLKFDEELSRLSLGIKQLSENPWDTVNDKIKIDDVVSTKVINITDNHINVIINDMFDGFISLNELSWIKKPPHPSKIVSLNDNVDVKILEIDSEKRDWFVV